MAEHMECRRTVRELLPKLLQATRLGALGWRHNDHGARHGYWVMFGKNTKLIIRSGTPVAYLHVDLVIRDKNDMTGSGWRSILDLTVGNDNPRRAESDDWDGSNLLQVVKNEVDGMQSRLDQASDAMDRVEKTWTAELRKSG